MSLSKHFKTVKELEKTGVRVEYGTNSKGKPIAFMIARSGGATQEYLNYLEAICKPHRHAIQTQRIDNEILKGLLQKAFIAKCLKGWENVEAEWAPLVKDLATDSEVYQDLAFTPENAERLYEEMPDLLDDHMELASKNAMYLSEVRKADAKN